MKKIFLLILSVSFLFPSCVSQKKYAALEAVNQQSKDLLNSATVKLNSCIDEKAGAEAELKSLKEQVTFLSNNNQDLINTMGNLTTLSQKGAENLEKSLESMKEKDLTINSMRDAVTRRDSVTLALVTSLKGTFIDISDKDIEVNVEKGVVFISISDKLLFNSGSYVVSERAKEVLGKVAKVVLEKPEIEFLVEGHTDDQSIQNEVLLDNWDLSVKRATSVVRVLQNDFGVQPERMTAAGRSYYVPVADNDTAENRSKNRRTRIVVLPKLDQFYDLIEQGMKAAGN
ncbi:MAG: OmpA family protein [Flavobacteriaceae bacterium]|jgi:chemotaxis protein MotB|nr:OmpA family protein [Flavobacteriaceae bacterium]MBT6169907.1 OmpA family protein [Flavobacteriaceae bacterium]MDG1830721.1 OmpA family protein [Flavobacteriaceae bacterium]|tara:strand:- start:18 stop:875 length:858 start_codon:yes stop_codon:yes gene_type:complete